MLPVDVLPVSSNLLRGDNDIVFYGAKSAQALIFISLKHAAASRADR